MAELRDMSDTKESSLKGSSLREAEVPRSSASSAEPIVNVDAAWKFLDANRELDGVDATEGELKRLRRKIDWHIVPIMFCCYTMQFLDKVILNVSGPATLCTPNPALARGRRRAASLPGALAQSSDAD